MTSVSATIPSSRERRFALVLLCLVLVANAVALYGDVPVGRVTGNDNVSHLALLKGMVRAIESGENPLDFWSPESSFGSAPIRTYQPLAHVLVAMLYFVLGKTVSLTTVFVWVRFLSVVLLPAGFFAAALLLELPPLTAAAAAMLSPLISTDGWYGLDYSSYVSTGRGLFPQSVAAILLLLSIGYGFRAVRHGRQGVLAGALLGLTCLSHFIYGWIGAVSLCLLALLPDPAVARQLRIRRTLCVGCVALVLSAFQLLPVWIDGPILNHSRWEEAWKWDSFGAIVVLKALLSGELLDHGRLPVLSLLALIGTGLIVWRFYKTRRLPAAEGFVLSGAVLWLLVFFGRPTWGPLLLLLGVTRDLHLHRVVGAVQIFLVLLAAIALATGWRELARRGYVALALLLSLVVLAPMLQERARYLARNEAQGTEILIAVDSEQAVLDAAIAGANQAGGRTYAGSGLGWGGRFQIGNIPFFAFLNMNLIPQASASYHMTALTADLLPLFDERNPAHYRLFNVRSVVAPANLASGLPGFLSPRTQFGHDRIFDAPGSGYFDIVDVAAAVAANKDSFYEVNERWLHSDWVEKRAHLWLDFRGDAPSGFPRLTAKAPLPPNSSPTVAAGVIKSERQIGQTYGAEFAISRPGFVLLKMTWHPNWVAYVDGKEQKTAMLSPGFIGVPVSPGQGRIVLRYEPGWWKVTMAFGGVLLVLLAHRKNVKKNYGPRMDTDKHG
jgi:Bacterial membrane protein YfhO